VNGSAVLSPDGRLLAFDRAGDVWTMDLEQGRVAKVTSNPAADILPMWSPNGRSIVFASNRDGAEGLYERALDVAGGDRVLVSGNMPLVPSDWSRDGRHLLYSAGGDIWALPMAVKGMPLQLTATPLIQEVAATFSPDRRWIAYQSDESKGVTRSGEGDVFLQSFPKGDFKLQVTSTGGFTPRWNDEGTELFYVAADGMLMAVRVATAGSALVIDAPRQLFRARLAQLSVAQPRYSRSKDGRFLLRLAVTEPQITVVVNWFEQLLQDSVPQR
jgi:Tol biopolymer transport system component